ncbi:hypothetical protein BDB01DRAFT_803718 [Pilobolus umbonatus]|nr:hypothetical protein BDB01DRAFT_803718 [Pilobolus umbonatus]
MFKTEIEPIEEEPSSPRVKKDAEEDYDSEKDLIIQSLNQVIDAHKLVFEHLQEEKQAYQEQVEKERAEEKSRAEEYRKEADEIMEKQKKRCEELEKSIVLLKQDIEAKKEEHKKLEVSFYSYVKTVRVTDDDLSTIQPNISHLLSQLNNTCMGLKSKMDRKAGTQFVYDENRDRVDMIKKHMLTADDELLDASYITLFVEKYLTHTLLNHIMDVPIQLGVSVNEPFQALDEWMSSRNKEWANRVRQQICSLLVQQPRNEERLMEDAKDELLQKIVNVLGTIYPALKDDPKKIDNLIQRTSRLNLAMKGQDIMIERMVIEEGNTPFNPETMKATAKGKPSGTVFLVITPPFIARDELDNEHGFTVPGKVFCI